MKLKLKVGDLTDSPFVGKELKVPVFLVDEGDKLISTKETVKLQVKADFESSPSRPCPDGFFEVNTTKSVIEGTGIGSVYVKFNAVSMNYENKKVVLTISATSGSNIQQVSTHALYICKYKLLISEENSEPYTWYKDEGGKDKCIELRVHLIDSENVKVRNRKVPLKVSLCYRGNGIVPQQNILQLSPDTRPVIDEHFGESIIKFRVNEVSTRHQGQMFQLLVAPDINVAPSSADVMSALCTPVDVKSKRNNHRDRDRNSSGGNGANLMRSSSTGSAVSVTPGQIGVRKAADVPDADISLKRARSDGSSSVQSYGGMGGMISDNMSGSYADYSNPSNLVSAIDNIVIWSNSVMRGLEQMRWKPIGYQQLPDGTPNPNQPLYSINNPQQVIADLGLQFSQFVKPSLQIVGMVADNGYSGNGNGASEDERLPPALPLTRGVTDVLEFLESTSTDPLNMFRVEDNMFSMQGNSKTPRLTKSNGKMAGSSLVGAETLDDVDKSWLQPPNLNRDISFNISSISAIEAPKLNRNHSLFLEPTVFPEPEDTGGNVNGVIDFAAALTRSMSVDVSRDRAVAYIIAKAFTTSTSCRVGLPAFDQNKTLIGFYKSCKGYDNVSYVSFTPTTTYAATQQLTEVDVAKCGEILSSCLALSNTSNKDESSGRIGFLFSLKGGRGSTLDKLKEDAIIYSLMYENDDEHNIKSE